MASQTQARLFLARRDKHLHLAGAGGPGDGPGGGLLWDHA